MKRDPPITNVQTDKSEAHSNAVKRDPPITNVQTDKSEARSNAVKKDPPIPYSTSKAATFDFIDSLKPAIAKETKEIQLKHDMMVNTGLFVLFIIIMYGIFGGERDPWTFKERMEENDNSTGEK